MDSTTKVWIGIIIAAVAVLWSLGAFMFQLIDAVGYAGGCQL